MRQPADTDKPNVVSDFTATDRIMLALSALAGVGIAALSLAQPWYADDYVQATVARHHPSLWRFVEYWYLNWSGRNTSTAFIWLSQVNRPVFSALVGMGFVIMAMLTVSLALGESLRRTHRNAELLVLALVVLWFGMPALGEVAQWLVGSATYLTAIVLMLLFLHPYRRLFEYDPAERLLPYPGIRAVPMLALGVVVGMSHECAVAGAGAALVVMLAKLWRDKMVRRVPADLWVGALGLAAGGTVLALGQMSALREQLRSAPALVGGVAGALRHLEYFLFTLGKGVSFSMPGSISWLLITLLLALPIAASTAAARTEDRSFGWFWPCTWIVAAAGTMAPFVFVTYPGGGRIYAFPFVFSVVAAFAVFAEHTDSLLDRLPQRRIAIGAIALVTIMLVEIGGSLLVQRQFGIEHGQRLAIIAEQRSEGIQDVVVPPYAITPHRAVPHDDITGDPNDWRNRAVADWLGVRSIRTSEESRTP